VPTYTIEQIPQEPIYVTIMTADYSVTHDQVHSTADGRAILEAVDEPVYWVVDVTQISISLDDIIASSNRGARGEEPLWHHPMIKEFIFVSPNMLVKLAAKGLNSEIFGNLNITVCDTLEQAIEECREKIRSGK
jgi:hypothetical protein